MGYTISVKVPAAVRDRVMELLDEYAERAGARAASSKKELCYAPRKATKNWVGYDYGPGVNFYLAHSLVIALGLKYEFRPPLKKARGACGYYYDTEFTPVLPNGSKEDRTWASITDEKGFHADNLIEEIKGPRKLVASLLGVRRYIRKRNAENKKIVHAFWDELPDVPKEKI